MKKCFVLLFVLLSVSCITIHANSAPIYGDYPGSVTVIPLDDHDIHVISETLIFDFQNNIADQEIEFGFRSPVAIVNAIYEMMNFGDGQYLKMAFPFYGTMSSELLEKTSIKMNGNTVNHKIYYGKLSDYYDFSGFEIESMYQEMVIIEEEFFQESVGLLYTFTQTEEDVYVVLEDHLEMQVIQSGFYRQYQSENIVLSGRGELQNPEIFILSNSSILDVQGLDVEVEEITYQTYLERFILNTTYSYEHAQVAFLEVLHYLSYNRTAYKSNLEYFLSNDRLMIFEYEAFVENGYNVMEVEYANMGAVYSRFTPYKYEYKYFLQPATLWKSFQNLTVQIYLSDDVAFLVDSNFMFEYNQEGFYQVHFEELPLEDLRFQISASANPRNNFSAFVVLFVIFFFGGALALLLFIFIMLRVARYVNNKNRSNYDKDKFQKLW